MREEVVAERSAIAICAEEVLDWDSGRRGGRVGSLDFLVHFLGDCRVGVGTGRGPRRVFGKPDVFERERRGDEPETAGARGGCGCGRGRGRGARWWGRVGKRESGVGNLRVTRGEGRDCLGRMRNGTEARMVHCARYHSQVQEHA